MQFEVHGNDWSHLWTEDTRLAAVILMLLIVCLNLFFRWEKQQEKSRTSLLSTIAPHP